VPLKVKSAILCDLVRTEDTGKHILIGVYVGAVAFESFPGIFAPVFWLQIHTEKPNEEFDLEVKVDAPLLAGLGTAELQVRSGPECEATIVLGGGPMRVVGPGRLTLSARRKGERWVTVLAKTLQSKEGSAPPAA
jgi:hypothetical protein